MWHITFSDKKQYKIKTEGMEREYFHQTNTGEALFKVGSHIVLVVSSCHPSKIILCMSLEQSQLYKEVSGVYFTLIWQDLCECLGGIWAF